MVKDVNDQILRDGVDHYQYHLNYLPLPLPPQLLQSKRWGEERMAEEPQKLSHALIYAHSDLD